MQDKLYFLRIASYTFWIVQLYCSTVCIGWLQCEPSVELVLNSASVRNCYNTDLLHISISNILERHLTEQKE